MRKLQSQGAVLYQSVSLKPITSSGATYGLRAKSRKEVDAAAKAKDGATYGDRNQPKVKRRSLGECVVKRYSSVVLGPEGRYESKVDFESAFSERSEGHSPKVQ